MTDRLSRQDWLKNGLQALVADGPRALKADVLAKRMGVSRGSFYWHFENLADFHAALLAHWQATSTQAVIEDLTADVKQTERLTVLIQRALSAEPALERAMRLWAAEAPDVARALAQVDETRIAYLVSLLAAGQMPRAKATDRARLIYWAYLGRMDVASPEHRHVSEDGIAQLVLALQD
ncbi:MAG: TetR/AcrR family transcriptional regulator [Pseudomonadota bacterium]